MADWGIKVSKPGFDVKTCDDKDLIMSSEFNTFKVKAVGSTSGTYAHGLAYVPAYFSSSQISATQYGIIGQVRFSGIPYTDATNFNANGGTSKYYLFYVQAS